LCRAFASKNGDKFEGVPFRLSEGGMPIIEGVVAWIDCNLHAVHEAGDHYIVLGRVHSMDVKRSSRPLIFFRGGLKQLKAAAV
jgi:flavin reductase (DIM6/NTAB) family NADH-FMN oxidoreductase RutF